MAVAQLELGAVGRWLFSFWVLGPPFPGPGEADGPQLGDLMGAGSRGAWKEPGAQGVRAVACPVLTEAWAKPTMAQKKTAGPPGTDHAGPGLVLSRRAETHFCVLSF